MKETVNYEKPIMDLIEFYHMEDVVTLSGGEEGKPDEGDFEDIFG